MTTIEIDNAPLNQSTSLLAAFESADRSEEIKASDLIPYQKALADEYGKMHDCEDRIAKGDEQIALLEKALAGWRRFTDHQKRRLPGLRRRYILARDYIRSPEDEQTGSLE